MMKDKSRYFLIGGIVLLVCVFIGISYAYWQLTLQQSGTNVVTTDCFNITFTDSNDINLQKAYPITDSEGSSLAPYTFTIENTCDGPAGYQINIETMSQDSGVKVLPEEYLKANLIETDSSNISTNNLTSDYEVSTTIDGAIKAYMLDTGIIQGKTSKTFELRLWLDYDTPVIDEVMNATYNGKISVISTYREAPSNMIMAKDFTIDPETAEGDINQDTMQIISDSFWQHNMNIKTITFESTLDPKEGVAYTYDISANQDGSVMAYLVENGTVQSPVTQESIPAYDMYIQSNGKVYANYDSSWLFGLFGNLTEINNLQNLDTSYATNMNSMFLNDGQLVELDLSSFDTSNVTDMGYMFSWMSFLTELDLSSFDTSNVTDMSSMFSWMPSLTELNLSSFDTSNVTNMSEMFYTENGSALTRLNLSTFDTSNVTDMSYMFFGMYSLTELDLSSFDTSNVTDMSGMFYYMVSLTKLDLSFFDTSNVTDMTYMFAEMYSLTKLDLSSFDTSSVTSMEGMFHFYDNKPSLLTSLNLSSFDTSNVTNMSYMFYGIDFLTELDLSSFDTSNVTDMSWMFGGMESLTELDLSSFDTSSVTDMSDMFSSSSLTTLDLSTFDTSNVTDMSSMFSWMPSLTELDLSSFDTSNVTDMSDMFYAAESLTELDLSHFNTSNVMDMSCMFAEMYSLTKLDLSSFDTSNVTNMSQMFYGSSSLTNITYGTKFVHASDANITSMFSNCPANKPTDPSWDGVF